MISTNLFSIKWFNYFFHYFENNCPPPFFGNEQNPIPKTKRWQQEAYHLPKSYIIIVNCIPPYIQPEKIQLQKGLKSFSRYYRKGYLLDFSEFENADSFLKYTLDSRSLKKLRRDFRRLDNDYSVDFKVFSNNITPNVFNSIMSSLKEMIIKRFSEKGIHHRALDRWDSYLKSAYEMINVGRASLFVYYIKEYPISIGLNYHDGENFFSAITSYDINYNKYGLGKLMLIKKIYWCFENNFTRMDLGWGNLTYKRKLANVIYQYKTQIIYNSNFPIMGIVAWIIGCLLEKKYVFLNRNK